MTVRDATLNDLPTLKKLCTKFRHERKQGNSLPYDQEMFMETLALSIESEEALVLMLDDTKGFFLGCLGTTPYSMEQVANEMVWYTVPEARGRGFALFKAYMKWAKEKKVKYVFMSLPEEHSIMSRLGFTLVDVGYFKKLH